MRLLPPPLDFFLNYPLKHYVQILFGATTRSDVTYCIGSRFASVLISDRKHPSAVFSPDVASYQGSPSAETLSPATSNASVFRIEGDYERDVNRKFYLNRGGYGAMIFENQRLYDNLHTIQGQSLTVAQMLAVLKTDDIKNIIATWQAAEPYEWAAFSETLELLHPKVNISTVKKLFLAGIPESQAQFYCKWASETGFILTAAIPLPIAVGNWALRRGMKDVPYYFLVIPGQQKYRVFFMKNGEVDTYIQSPTAQFVSAEIAALIGECMLDNPDCPNPQSYIWLNASVDINRVIEQLKNEGLKNVVPIDEVLLQKVYGDESPKYPLAAISDWIAGAAIPGHIDLVEKPEDLVIGGAK